MMTLLLAAASCPSSSSSSWPEAVVAVAGIAFFAFIVWLMAR